MPARIQKVILLGAGGLLGTEVLAAFEADASFDLTLLVRKSSKSTFPPHLKIVKVDHDSPHHQLVQAFTGQDAVVLAIPGRPVALHMRIIDAAVEAGVKRFIPSEFGNNTCTAASELCPLYADKAKTAAYLKSKEATGMTWTAIHTGQFFDWGIRADWLDYYLNKKRAIIYDSGNKLWSTTNVGTAAAAVVKVLHKPEETVNRAVFVASFTVSQNQVLNALQAATGVEWETRRMTSVEALKKAERLDNEEYSIGLKLRILMLLYAEDADRGANFEKDGLLDNKLLGLPEENLEDTIQRILGA
ncbi:isoflavone reductase family protein [Stachybotrys elegans]|uniref:Isoflavone reductase family protein n=1 Tax=Stachybotrys elegans TaxID=80388 RepID=A0A8K0SCS7_9HYPO|nr:isoflavone reductase family protein [Stachybotrys elegans]